jgi:hypothetical protein
MAKILGDMREELEETWRTKRRNTASNKTRQGARSRSSTSCTAVTPSASIMVNYLHPSNVPHMSGLEAAPSACSHSHAPEKNTSTAATSELITTASASEGSQAHSSSNSAAVAQVEDDAAVSLSSPAIVNHDNTEQNMSASTAVPQRGNKARNVRALAPNCTAMKVGADMMVCTRMCMCACVFALVSGVSSHASYASWPCGHILAVFTYPQY